MVFTKDTTFLNLVRGERDHENYGITHTIKHVFVDEKEKNLLLECYKFDCRSCGSFDLKRVVLPPPLGPNKTKYSPSAIFRSTFFNAYTSPYVLTKFLTSIALVIDKLISKIYLLGSLTTLVIFSNSSVLTAVTIRIIDTIIIATKLTIEAIA